MLIRVQADPRFVRDGDDLWTDIPLTFTEAALGTRVEVPTPDGSRTIDVAPGTQPLSKQVLPGRGMPNVRGRGRGNLVVRFVVLVPKELSSEARELIESSDRICTARAARRHKNCPIMTRAMTVTKTATSPTKSRCSTACSAKTKVVSAASADFPRAHVFRFCAGA